MSRRGDDLPDVLQQWAQALWDASEVVPAQKRVELLKQAADRAASSVRLQALPVPETTCLLGDILVALGEHVWKSTSNGGAKAGAGAGGLGEGTGEEGAACVALWHCRRALHQGYAEAMRVRSRDLSILCGLADAFLDCGRLQQDMLTHGVDLALAQPAAVADASTAAAPSQPPLPAPSEMSAAPPPPPPPPPPVPAMLPTPMPSAGCGWIGDVLMQGDVGGEAKAEAKAEAEAEAEAGLEDLTDEVDRMQMDAPVELVQEVTEPPVSLPPLPSAADCLERAASLYAQVLESSAAEWAAARVSRLDTMYNAACACALRGGRDEDCAKLLAALAAEGALRRAELEGDADLAPLVPTPWMQSLLHGA